MNCWTAGVNFKRRRSSAAAAGIRKICGYSIDREPAGPTVNELLHAWAIFGLKPGSSVMDLRSRYRALAKKWHPDRYTSDPQGQSEAAIQMRVLNSAYERLLTAAATAEAAHAPMPKTAQPEVVVVPQRGRLSREELDRMIAALGTESYVEGMLDAIGNGFPYGHVFSKKRRYQFATSSLAAALAAAGCLVVGLAVWQGINLLRNPGWLCFLLPAVIVVFLSRRNAKPNQSGATNER
jgi:hypothetical protein